MDFGVIKTLIDINEVTQDGDFLGTPRYSAREYLLGEDNSSFQIDICSLGYVFYLIFTGKEPFHETNNKAKLILKVITEYPELTEILDYKIKLLILGMIDKNCRVRIGIEDVIRRLNAINIQDGNPLRVLDEFRSEAQIRKQHEIADNQEIIRQTGLRDNLKSKLHDTITKSFQEIRNNIKTDIQAELLGYDLCLKVSKQREENIFLDYEYWVRYDVLDITSRKVQVLMGAGCNIDRKIVIKTGGYDRPFRDNPNYFQVKEIYNGVYEEQILREVLITSIVDIHKQYMEYTKVYRDDIVKQEMAIREKEKIKGRLSLTYTSSYLPAPKVFFPK
jgi:hypothetical protein